jgi:hypothetical protein
MQATDPDTLTPSSPPQDPAAALHSLARWETSLCAELAHLPKAPQALLDALKAKDTSQIQTQTEAFLQQLDRFWLAQSALDDSRRNGFAASLARSFRDEATFKAHERELSRDAAQCLPAFPQAAQKSPTGSISNHSLYIRINDQTYAEIKGALVMSAESGKTLLALPGSGLIEFATQKALLEKVVAWLNDPVLRWALLVNADQQHQDAALAVIEESQLFIEAFSLSDVQLQVVTTDPYWHVLNRQINKQRRDVRYACGEGLLADPLLHARQIESAVAMSGLFGPSGMLKCWQQVLDERELRKSLPDWFKQASVDDRKAWMQRLERYDLARIALSSALSGAGSAVEYAQLSLRTRLATDLGYDLAPETITISTRRTLPVTEEEYVVSNNLLQLALHGLHPGDELAGSAFLTQTTLSIGDTPADARHAALTPAYIARLINQLKLRVSFGQHQQTAYAKQTTQELMAEQMHLQMAESLLVAKLQGHIKPEDFDRIEPFTGSSGKHSGQVIAQQIRINGNDIMGRILVFRIADSQGNLERLVMFTSQSPEPRQFYGFNNETQLLHELVGWTASPDMSQYLLQQANATNRPALATTLESLRNKPFPEDGFLAFVPLDSYDGALRAQVSELISVMYSNQQAHTPDWLVRASDAQRQELVALEDAVKGAIDHYAAKPHTRVEEFAAYVKRRASENINRLLKTPAGSVDPDQIIITSERETLTYTQMIRDGYDDSIGLLTATADTVATFKGPDGVDLSALTPAIVAGSVRGKWLADEYNGLIKSTLLDPGSVGYQYRRRTSTLITQLQIKAAALRSLLKGHIDAPQYEWLLPSLNNLHDDEPATRKSYPVYPLQIHVDKPFIASRTHLFEHLVIPDTDLSYVETAQGCFALIPTTLRLAALLYTPQAPDGREFRLFSSFEQSLAQPGMIDYYKDRCRIDARRILSFFLNDMKQGNATKAPLLKDPITQFAQACFDRPIERKLRDVADTTTGRSDMLERLIWDSIDVIATVLTLPFPPASFAVGIALSLRDSLRAIEALTGSNPEEAGMHVIASVLNSAGAAGDLTAGLKGFGGIMRKLSSEPSATALPVTLKRVSSLPTYDELFPLQLQDEMAYVTRPNVNRHVEVYKSLGSSSDDAYATRHYAARDKDGAWQPLGQAPDIKRPQGPLAVNPGRAVSISLQELPRATEGHGRGVSMGVNGKSYIEMDGMVYQVNYDTHLRNWYIVDPANPYAFFGRQPVSLNDQGQWQLRQAPALRGGVNGRHGAYRALPEDSAGDQVVGASRIEYEMPADFQRDLNVILKTVDGDPMGLGLDEMFAIYYGEMRATHATLKGNLYRDAQAFFSRPPALPPRPTLPALDPSTSVDSLLQNLFTHSNGVIISEAPKSVASKRLLMTHMQTLVEQRVEVIYLPHLFTDKHLKKLAKYRAKGSKFRSGSHEIRNHLAAINDGALDNLSQEYDYYHLIKLAHRHNIEIRPLSASTSYPVDALPLAGAVDDSTAPQKMSNYFAHKVISDDVASDPSKRWIALLEQKFANTQDNVPGVAQLEGAISVHIDDLPADSATLVRREADQAGMEGGSVRSDFTIGYARTASANPAPTAPTTVVQLENPVQGTGITDGGMRWDGMSGWQPIAPQEWVPVGPQTPLQLSLADDAYEMPVTSRDTLYELTLYRRRGMDTRYTSTEEHLRIVEDQFTTLRDKLREDARQVLTVEPVPRPTMPVIEPQLSTPTFIERLYQQTDGMVIGEYHSSIGSKKLIIDNLPLLARQKVQTLYLEHLFTDLHQLDLDRFAETGVMNKHLLQALHKLDVGHMTDPQKIYTFETLVVKAREHGIEVRAIDCAASYHLKGLRGPTTTARQEMFSYFASRTIRRHQAALGKHKWVALVGNSHSNTYANTVPGLAELEAGIGLRVSDVPAGSASGISVDTGESVRLHLSSRKQFIKGDFDVKVEVRDAPVASGSRPPLEERLSKPGMFVTEQLDDGHVVVHRSRDLGIHRTPVQTDSDGKLFVDRPTWTTVHLQPYDDIDALVAALRAMNLTFIK